MTLADFLLARITEDEAAATLVLKPYGDRLPADDAAWWRNEREWFNIGLCSDNTPLLTRYYPQRVLAECEAKRRIVERIQYDVDHTDNQPDNPDLSWFADELLAPLALPYADHPDYDEAWRV